MLRQMDFLYILTQSNQWETESKYLAAVLYQVFKLRVVQLGTRF